MKIKEALDRHATREVWDEVAYRLEIAASERENEPGEGWEEYGLEEAFEDALKFSENDDTPRKFRTDCRRIAIALGWYVEATEDELRNTVVSSGRKFDFQLDGKKYRWEGQ